MTQDANTIIEPESSGEAFAPAPAASAEKPKATKATKAAEVPAPKKVRIILEENDNIPPTGLFVGINGRSYLVRAGEEVTVPVEVVEVLDDAVESTPKTDASGNVVDYRNKMRFPYRLLGPA